MPRKCIAAVASLTMLGLGGTAHALPIMVDYNDINVATLEDFQSSPAGDVGTSEAFDGFTATVDMGNLFIAGSTTFCDTAGDQCLTNQNASGDLRTFGAFAAGTNFFGLDLTAITEADVFRIDVTGGSGSETFNVTGSGLLGFGDTSGLSSVSILNLGPDGVAGSPFSNYGLDDVITGLTANLDDGSPSSVPEPASMALFGAGLAGLGLLVRRRKRAA